MTSYLISIIAGWLALACIVGWCAPKRWQMFAVSACGVGLVGSTAPVMLAFLTVTVPTSIAVAASRRRRFWTPLFVIAVAATYGCFLLLTSLGERLKAGHWAVPFAMAYTTLRLIHYVLDADRASLPRHRWEDAVNYQLFPPVLAVGPINRFGAFKQQLRDRRWNSAQSSRGLSRILLGAAKIVIIGNFLVAILMPVAVSNFGETAGWYLAQLQFWLSLYFQFSGYTDVAIGTAAMLGFDMPENFNYPFIACNIGDFWRRWHITLANWCRDYVYMPVFARWRSAVVATGASMVTLGLWHEASLHYLLWGGYHATGLSFWRAFQKRTRSVYDNCSMPTRRIWDAFAWLLTIHFVVMSYAVTTWIERSALGR